MKTSVAIAAAGLIGFGIVGTTPAAAYHLTPEGKSFVGNGNTSATKLGITLKCTAKFTGKVSSTGVGSVTGGSFTGAFGCTSVKLSHLPWKSVAVSATKVNIENATFSSPIGNCGPSTVPTTLKGGVISFTNVALAGSCTISGSLKTTPTLSIAPGAGAWWAATCSHMHCATSFSKSDE